jgi:hypothetical protein
MGLPHARGTRPSLWLRVIRPRRTNSRPNPRACSAEVNGRAPTVCSCGSWNACWPWLAPNHPPQQPFSPTCSRRSRMRSARTNTTPGHCWLSPHGCLITRRAWTSWLARSRMPARSTPHTAQHCGRAWAEQTLVPMRLCATVLRTTRCIWWTRRSVPGARRRMPGARWGGRTSWRSHSWRWRMLF